VEKKNDTKFTFRFRFESMISQPICTDQFAQFLATHAPDALATFAPAPSSSSSAITEQVSSEPVAEAAADDESVERKLLANLRTRLLATHLSLDDARPLLLARPHLTEELQRADAVWHAVDALDVHSVSWWPKMARRDQLSLAVLALACALVLQWALAPVAVLAGALAVHAWRRWRRIRTRRRILAAQASAAAFGEHCAALDAVTVRALRALQESELLARGRRPSSAVVSVGTTLDDAARHHRDSALLASISSALARVYRDVQIAQREWRARLATADVVVALATVSDRRVAALQSTASIHADEFVAFLDAAAPVAGESPRVTAHALKLTHQVNCAARSHVLALLLLASDDTANIDAIDATVAHLADRFAPLIKRVEGALEQFKLVLPDAAAASPPASTAAKRLQRRSRRTFHEQLARGAAAVDAKLAALCWLLRQPLADACAADEQPVSIDDVNAAYARFRRVRDDVRDALHEWERAHAVLASVCSLGGEFDDDAGSSSMRRTAPAAVSSGGDIGADDASGGADEADGASSLFVEERSCEYDGAHALDDDANAAPITREQRIERMAARRAERERRAAEEAKQRLSSDLIDELAQLLQRRKQIT
jgi:hypothetical protein